MCNVTTVSSLHFHLGLDVVDSLLSFAKHVKGTVDSAGVHPAHVLLIIHIFLLESREFELLSSHGCHALSLSLSLTENCSLGEALLIDFRYEWILLLQSITERPLGCLLLLVLRCLVLEGVLVEDLVFALPRAQPVLVASIILELAHDRGLGVIGSNALILDMDLVNPALLDQSSVLLVAQHALLTSLKLLPGLLFDHGSVSVQVLSLQAYLLELLSESSLLFSFLLLLGLDLSVHLQEALFPGGLRLGGESVGIVLLLETASVVLGLPSNTSLFNLLRLFHEPLGLLLLASQVSLPFKFSLLLHLSLLELESLTQLSYRHLLHQAVSTCFRRVKAFGPLDGDLLELTDLSNQLHSLR